MQDFEEIARSLASGRKPPAESLEELSSLDPEGLASFEGLWRSLDSELRRLLLRELNRIAGEDLLMDFSSIGALVVSDPDPSVRGYGVRLLGQEAAPALLEPCLRLAVNDPDMGVRLAALDALGAFALAAQADAWPRPLEEQIQATLLRQLRAWDAPIAQREAALLSLAYLTTPEVEDEIRRAHAELDLRSAAIEAMGRNCQELWIPELVAELSSSDPELRVLALEAFGEMEDEQVVPEVAKSLGDSDPEVRQAAIQTLGAIGGPDARAELERLQNSRDEETRIAAAEALAEAFLREDPLAFEG